MYTFVWLFTTLNTERIQNAISKPKAYVYVYAREYEEYSADQYRLLFF